MTRDELIGALEDFRRSLSMMADQGEKDVAVTEAITALRDAVAYRTEREFAAHCRTFDPRAVLARMDAESRVRRVTGPLTLPPGAKE